MIHIQEKPNYFKNFFENTNHNQGTRFAKSDQLKVKTFNTMTFGKYSTHRMMISDWNIFIKDRFLYESPL